MSDSDFVDSVGSDDSDYNYLPGYELEVEPSEENPVLEESECEGASGPYADEPIASDEWITKYEEEREEEEAVRLEFQKRLEGVNPSCNWCKCGNCKVDLLQNVYETKCCTEIEQCVTALNTELVVNEVGTAPPCITLHPGFRIVCMEPWSLRLAAGKYKIIDGSRYHLTGSEEAFFRAVSYREFSQLVHGKLGNVRIPLPSCAYDAIRNRFRAQGENFGGFQEDQE